MLRKARFFHSYAQPRVITIHTRRYIINIY